jgi:Rieske Fe-S protein
MNRRLFVTSSLFSIAALFIKACIGIKSTTSESGLTFKLIDLPKLQNIGGISEISIQGKHFFAVRITQQKISVMSQLCTHRGCTLFTQNNGNGFECPCHGSSFDLNGDVTRGPALRSLEKRTVVFDEVAGTFKVF